jgi:hypothetical protein
MCYVRCQKEFYVIRESVKYKEPVKVIETVAKVAATPVVRRELSVEDMEFLKSFM